MRYLPAPDRLYRHYFLLYPLAVESVDLRQYDLVVSSCWGYAKGVHTRPDAVHVCYCHTPMRWVWRYDDYVARERLGPVQRLVAAVADRAAAAVGSAGVAAPRLLHRQLGGRGADAFAQFYGRDVDRHSAADRPRPLPDRRAGSATTTWSSSRLVAYKRIDLAIEACNLLRRAAGDHRRRARPAAARRRWPGRPSSSWAASPTTVVTTAAAECRALLFPGEEDFGIVPLEANASGRPVVAWQGGGALETVIDGETGVFFDEPTPESLAAAIERLRADGRGRPSGCGRTPPATTGRSSSAGSSEFLALGRARTRACAGCWRSHAF